MTQYCLDKELFDHLHQQKKHERREQANTTFYKTILHIQLSASNLEVQCTPEVHSLFHTNIKTMYQ